MPVENVRRDGTGNPDSPRTLLRAIEPASQASERQDAEASLRGVSAGQDARRERPARWHGQPRPTQEVASSAISPASQASERQDAEASLRGVSAGQDARSERPARWHGQSRPRRQSNRRGDGARRATRRSAGISAAMLIMPIMSRGRARVSRGDTQPGTSCVRVSIHTAPPADSRLRVGGLGLRCCRVGGTTASARTA